jgi:ABC-2 type transport system permease protein
VATYNPVTYVLDGLRSLISEGWAWSTLAYGAAATLALMVVSFGFASIAMKGRMSRG